MPAANVTGAPRPREPRAGGMYAGPKQSGWNFVHAALGVVRRPARRDPGTGGWRECAGRRRGRTSGASRAAPGSGRPASTSMREHRLARRMDVEQPASFDDEAHFVLVVPVLAAELREHRVEVRRLGLDVDHVGVDVAAARLERVDLRRLGGEDLLGGGSGSTGRSRHPALILDAVLGEESANVRGLGERRSLLRNPDHAMLPPPRGLCVAVRPIVSNRNSRISMCRTASASDVPHV